MDILTKILEASIDLFRQYGFKAVTMDDIARRAGISKKTLYQHFANKQEVVTETVSWYQGQTCDMCLATLDAAENAVDGMVRIMVKLGQVYSQINPIAIREMERFFPDAYKIFREHLATRDVACVYDTIEQGKKEGLFRENVKSDLMARLHIETSMMLLFPNMLVTEKYNIQQVNYDIVEHFLYGIMTPKGENLYQNYKEQYIKQATNI